MRYLTNFAARSRHAVLVLHLLAGGLAVISLTMLVLGWIEHARMREDVGHLQQRLQRLEARNQTLKEALQPSREDLSHLVEKVALLNRLLDAGSGNPVELLQLIEHALPDELIVQTAQYDGRRGELSLVAEASDSSVLVAFIEALEAQDTIASVELRRQRQSGRDATRAQFELGISEVRP